MEHTASVFHFLEVVKTIIPFLKFFKKMFLGYVNWYANLPESESTSKKYDSSLELSIMGKEKHKINIDVRSFSTKQ